MSAQPLGSQPQPHDEQDRYYMQRAIALAQAGEFTARPNPQVGCVLVRDGEIVGEGFHPRAGEGHAEVHALAQAGARARGATAYVTLEPCAHTGRTPPCSDALIKAGVERVVIASLDPNPLVGGQGRDRLEAAGIPTAVGIEQDAAQRPNRGFLRTIAGGLPWVRLKVGMSLDGRTAMASGESQWITGAEARAQVQADRARSGAVITGINTVLADDPQLNVRALPVGSGVDVRQVPQPLRVVLDRQGRIPADARLLDDPSSLVIVGPRAPEGITRWDTMSLRDVLQRLAADHQIRDVLIESGPQLAGAFLDAGLVDELIVYQAPVLLGSTARPMAELPLERLRDGLHWQRETVNPVGNDLRMTFVRQRPATSPLEM